MVVFHSFQLWNDLFSNSTKQCEEYKKLTFYLHVHFAILPKRKLYVDQYKEHGKKDKLLIIMQYIYNSNTLYNIFNFFYKLELTSEINTPKLSSVKENSVLKSCKEVTYIF